MVYLRALKSLEKSNLDLAHDTDNENNKEETKNKTEVSVAQKNLFLLDNFKVFFKIFLLRFKLHDDNIVLYLKGT